MRISSGPKGAKRRWGWGSVFCGGLLLVGAGALAGCGGGGAAPPPCGTAALAAEWSITANGAPVSCDQAGATDVNFVVDGMEESFPCTAFSAQTDEFDAGTHDVTLQLRDSSDNVLSQLGPMTVTLDCGELVDLGAVEFSLTP